MAGQERKTRGRSIRFALHGHQPTGGASHGGNALLPDQGRGAIQGLGQVGRQHDPGGRVENPARRQRGEGHVDRQHHHRSQKELKTHG